MNENTPSKIDLGYTENKVVFLFCDCSLDKKFSFWKFENREQAEMFINRLKHLEELKWSQLAALSREQGLTKEIPGTASYEMIDSQNTSPEKMGGEKYYFHFRVRDGNLFRVFGYQKKQYFCITHIDKKGEIHH